MSKFGDWINGIDWPEIWRTFNKTWVPVIITLGLSLMYEKTKHKKFTPAEIVFRLTAALATVYFFTDWLDYFVPYDADGPDLYKIALAGCTLVSDNLWAIIIHEAKKKGGIREILKWILNLKK